MPRALVGEGRGNRYAGVDVSKAGLATQKRFLDEMDPRLSKDCSQVVASMFKLPQGDASQDLMVARASLPVFGPFDDLRAAFAESARVLRKGGEFVVDSCPFELMPPAVVQDILDHFDIVESERMGTDRMLVLRRK